MPVPRRDLVDSEKVGTYHCIARCVRRAFLCGVDKFTGRCFEHRRVWVRDRLFLLQRYFAVEIIEYSVMSNHLHTLLTIRPDISSSWTSREVAERWVGIFSTHDFLKEEKIRTIVSDPERVEVLRERLSSLSWFHRCLNENIARRANAEDDCTGRFWEGRFTSQKVTGMQGLIACAIYIALNPIRANMALNLNESVFTGAHDRVHKEVDEGSKIRAQALVPVEEFSKNRFTEQEYLRLIDATVQLHSKDEAVLPSLFESKLLSIGINPVRWKQTSSSIHLLFKRIIGSKESIQDFASERGKRWFQVGGINRNDVFV